MIADGKKIAEIIRGRLQGALVNKTVCFVMFGEDFASKKFVERKVAFATSIGVHADVLEHPAMPFDEIARVVLELAKSDYDGIVIQLPLPQGIDAQTILNLIPAEKDIDVLSDRAKEAYRSGESHRIPPVARAVEEILSHHGMSFAGKKVLVIGKGRLVGEPVCMMLEKEECAYSVIDKDTSQEVQEQEIRNADIIVSGAGSPHLIRPDLIREGAALIDAGTSEDKGKLIGDIDPACEAKASLLTPVPGGVGPVTVASLFLNL